MRIKNSAHAEKVKALGICLVVLGHTPGVPRQLLELIYAFHMPLFFFLSGGARGGRVNSSRVFLVGVIRSLLFPFYFYLLISAVAWAIASGLGARFDSFERFSVQAVIRAFMQATFEDLRFNVVLWFFPALIGTVITHHLMRRLLSTSSVMVLCSLMLCASMMESIPRFTELPWCVGVLPVSLWFYALGEFCRHFLDRRGMMELSWWMSLILFFVLLVTSHANGWVNLARGLHGNYPWMFVANALTGVLLIFWAAAALPDFQWLRSLGAYSVSIFPLHTLVFGFMTAIGTRVFGLSRGFQSGSVEATVLYFIVSLLLSYFIARVLARIMPVAVGWRKVEG